MVNAWVTAAAIQKSVRPAGMVGAYQRGGRAALPAYPCPMFLTRCADTFNVEGLTVGRASFAALRDFAHYYRP